MKAQERIPKSGRAGERLHRAIPHLISVGITLVVGFAVFYLTLPPINAQSPGFWSYLFFLMLLYSASHFLLTSNYRRMKREVNTVMRKKKVQSKEKVGVVMNHIPRVLVILTALPLVVLLFGGIISSTFFHAREYASVIRVENADFKSDMVQSDSVTNIALMDSTSAVIIGNKTLGQLSDVVSQYEIGTSYTQINYHGTPKKVANLEYAGFFKWINNRNKGVPGYVMVDPVGTTAQYGRLTVPLRYVESAYFGEDLMRKLRFDYPTKIFGSVKFEIDEDGTPWYIVACMKPKVGLFGASDVHEVILFDPTDGTSKLLGIQDVPAWVDAVFDGDLATKKYNWYGKLSGGFWNSIIGNVDCKVTTDDYGYIAIEDDVWYYTGVTSLTSDESNIGFMLCNARTGEYKYYQVAGADEAAAMGSAQGKVQNMGYIASFPALINVDGEATYIMVLKDNSGLVKNYALVNVEHYELVATAATQSEAFSAYRKLLLSSGTVEAETTERTATVAAVHTVTFDGEPVVYFTASSGEVYRGSLKEDESLILIQPGDTVIFTVIETETPGLYRISQHRVPSESE